MARQLPPIPNKRRLEIAITFELYATLANQYEQFVEPGQLASALEGFQPGLLSRLATASSVHGYYSIDENDDFWITTSGIELITSYAESENKDIQAYMQEGITWVMKPDPSDTGANVTTTEEDAGWEPLPIDRGHDDYVAMISAAEAALKQIEGSNGYAASDPEERNGVVGSIKSALQTISDGQPSRTYIRAALVAPLQFVAKKFAEAIVGQFAKSAAIAVLKWLANFHA